MITKNQLELIIKEEIEAALLEEGFKDKLTKGLAGLALAGGLGLATPNVASAEEPTSKPAITMNNPSLGFSMANEEQKIQDKLREEIFSTLKADKTKMRMLAKLNREEPGSVKKITDKMLIQSANRARTMFNDGKIFFKEADIKKIAQEIVDTNNDLRPDSIKNMQR